MRVITGIAKGRRLKTLEGNDVRPTTDKVKEAIFSSIQFDIEHAHVLDLFAGSGQLGIEAISRGAKNAVFVDLNPHAIETVKENLSSTNLAENATVVRADCFSFIASTDKVFDIAFLDPPYRDGILEKTLSAVTGVMSENGIIVCERPLDIRLPEVVGSFYETKQLKFGKILVSVYRKESV